MTSQSKHAQKLYLNDPFTTNNSSRIKRYWNLNSTDKPCVSIEANIDGK